MNKPISLPLTLLDSMAKKIGKLGQIIADKRYKFKFSYGACADGKTLRTAMTDYFPYLFSCALDSLFQP